MTVHTSAEQLRARLAGMMERQAGTPQAGALQRARAVVAFVHRDPDLILLLDGRGETVQASWDTLDPAPELIFEFPSAEIAHRFWAGELNVMAALAAQQMSARGNVFKALALLPAAAGNRQAYLEAVAQERAGP